jgi:tRNA-binding EMAP/Myf-like protein
MSAAPVNAWWIAAENCAPIVRHMRQPKDEPAAKKKSHQAPVVRIPEIQKHPNADTLGIVHIDGYQIVVKLGEFEAGSLAVYVQPDSVVPNAEEFDFLWADKGFTLDDEIPPRYRRVIPRKFRKEWSEGLLIHVPMWVRYDDHGSWRPVQEGDDLSDILGITHWEPAEPADRQPRKDRDGRPRSLKGWWHWLLAKLGFRTNGNLGGANNPGPKDGRRVYDVEGYKNYPKVFEPGEQVIVTEKIHGSNARYTFEDGVMYVGSRTLWKSPKAKCIWRDALEQNPAIEEYCRAHPGQTLYGEVVPTQGDKYLYGCKPGEARFFLFDILGTDGSWLPKEYVININALWRLGECLTASQ